jgi:peptide subunit release factor 1 (eRF1)
MFDRVLGRAGLKDRIEELEAELAELREENERLQDRLDAESERRSEAVSARQDAQEQANRLEDRIAQLKGELERRESEQAGPQYRGVESIRGERTREVLDRLDSIDAGEEGALTVVVEDQIPMAVRDAFGERGRLVERAAPCVAVTDDAGLVSAALSGAVRPDPGVTWDRGFELDRSDFLPTGRFALALVRADLFALGEYDGREQLDYRGFETDVKGDHSKGGYSQARFERLRDEQIDHHVDRCREAIGERDADRLFVVGDRAAVSEFADVAVTTAAVDASGDPEDALARAFREFWTTKLYLI